jgi:hypothetical protein
MQRDIVATAGELPGRLRSSQSASDNGYTVLHTATASGVGATSHSFAHLMQRL